MKFQPIIELSAITGCEPKNEECLIPLKQSSQFYEVHPRGSSWSYNDIYLRKPPARKLYLDSWLSNAI
jgi:hypothetical protein